MRKQTFSSYFLLWALLWCGVGAEVRGQAIRKTPQLVGTESNQPAATPSDTTEPIRLALVIGNGNYRGAGFSFSEAAHIPLNDARGMKAALERLGFQVLYGEDLTQAETDALVARFIALVNRTPRRVALAYFSGHGVQLAASGNYLLPVDTALGGGRTLAAWGLSVNSLLSRMSLRNGQSGSNVLLLDACRDLPPARHGELWATGLARIFTPPRETFIGFATRAGQTAIAGTPEQTNSYYTTGLLRFLETPYDLPEVMRRVREYVLELSHGRQLPDDYNNLSREFSFVPNLKAARELTQQAQQAIQRNQWERAYSLTQQALRLCPRAANAYLVQGNIMEGTNRPAEAVTNYREARRLDEDLAAAYLGEMRMHLALRQAREAVELGQEVIRRFPALTGGYVNTGAAYYYLQEWPAALQCFNRALEIDRQNAGVYYNRARVYVAQRNYAAALQDVEQALRYKPAYREAQQLREWLLGQIN